MAVSVFVNKEGGKEACSATNIKPLLSIEKLTSEPLSIDVEHLFSIIANKNNKLYHFQTTFNSSDF